MAASPTFSHRLPHVFTNPDGYEPDRFAPPREEDKPVPFSYIGFGGGRHGCMVRRVGRGARGGAGAGGPRGGVRGWRAAGAGAHLRVPL